MNKVWAFNATLSFGAGDTEMDVFIQRLVAAPPEWGYRLVRMTVLDYLRETYGLHADSFTLHSVTECKSTAHLVSQLVCLDARSRTTCQLSQEQVADALPPTTARSEEST